MTTPMTAQRLTQLIETLRYSVSAITDDEFTPVTPPGQPLKVDAAKAKIQELTAQGSSRVMVSVFADNYQINDAQDLCSFLANVLEFQGQVRTGRTKDGVPYAYAFGSPMPSLIDANDLLNYVSE